MTAYGKKALKETAAVFLVAWLLAAAVYAVIDAILA